MDGPLYPRLDRARSLPETVRVLRISVKVSALECSCYLPNEWWCNTPFACFEYW